MKYIEFPLEMMKPAVVECVYRYYLQGMAIEHIACAMQFEHLVHLDVQEINSIIDQKNIITQIA